MNTNPFVEDNRDSDIFTADYARKTLIVPEGNKVFGVKGDHYGRVFRCKLLNYPDTTVRFTNDTAVAYLQFENAVGETGSVKLTITETTNRNDANKEGESAVLLSATIPNSLTKEAGTARLQLCGSYQASNGTWIHWHLSPVEVEIADFFDNEDIAVSDPKYSLVEQAHEEINALKGQVKDLQTALHNSLEDIKAALGDLDGSNIPESTVTQVTANRASILALQQKVTELENAGVDIDSLSETFATLEAVAAEYETKVHASATYMRKDDEDYANVVNRVKNLENNQNSYLSKEEAADTYVKNDLNGSNGFDVVKVLGTTTGTLQGRYSEYQIAVDAESEADIPLTIRNGGGVEMETLTIRSKMGLKYASIFVAQDLAENVLKIYFRQGDAPAHSPVESGMIPVYTFGNNDGYISEIEIGPMPERIAATCAMRG